MFCCLTVLKPDRFEVSEYVPDGNRVKRKFPCPSVTAVRVPCKLGERTSTVTPGSGFPAWVTLPSMAPVVAVCANAPTATSMHVKSRSAT